MGRMLGILAGLATVPCVVMFLPSRDDPSWVYWLGYAVFSAFVLVLWVMFGR